MPRYRCLFRPRRSLEVAADRGPVCGSAADSTRVGLHNVRGLELAYEFDAPDKTTLESWLANLGLAPVSVTQVDAA